MKKFHDSATGTKVLKEAALGESGQISVEGVEEPIVQVEDECRKVGTGEVADKVVDDDATAGNIVGNEVDVVVIGARVFENNVQIGLSPHLLVQEKLV